MMVTVMVMMKQLVFIKRLLYTRHCAELFYAQLCC
jgi:hypothetical protein